MIDLETCQKAINLLILSQGSDKIVVQSCFAKVFDALNHVVFDKDNIIAFQSISAGYEGATDV